MDRRAYRRCEAAAVDGVSLRVQHEPLTRTIIGAGMKAHRVLGPGFLESIYKNALAIELRAAGLLVEREVRFKVRYEGVEVGEYSADMFVQGSVLVEVKAIRALAPKDEMQLVHYLTGTRLASQRHGQGPDSLTTQTTKRQR